MVELSMQTFLPTANFEECAAILDGKRQWKQTVETAQLINTLENGGGWLNHPACRMWRKNIDCLKHYFNVMLEESIKRGIKVKKYKKLPVNIESLRYPIWLGFPKLHSTHRGRLLDKKPDYYNKFGWLEIPIPESSGYYWVTEKDGRVKQEVLDWFNNKGK
mgnify:FL=1